MGTRSERANAYHTPLFHIPIIMGYGEWIGNKSIKSNKTNMHPEG